MFKNLLTFLTLVLLTAFVQAQNYVGPEKCLQCHNNPALGDATGWRSSMHANGYSVVEDSAYTMQVLDGIVADYDQNGVDDFVDGLDFNNISSAFDAYKPNAPILGYSDTSGYTITIGDATHRVYLTYGGSGRYKQRYGVKINTSEGETQGIYISPIQFNEKTHEYVTYHAGDWYDGSNLPIYTSSSTLVDAAGNGRSLAKGCAGCHVPGLKLDKNASGEWIAHGGSIDPSTLGSYTSPNIWDLDGDGTQEQINVGCEACHGPGGDHVSAPSPANIINPNTLTTDQANNICGMCHSRGSSSPNNTFKFPYNDADTTGWMPGDMVADFYNYAPGLWGDGINSSSHHQQFLDFYKSSKPTFTYHMVRCSECHDVHNTVGHHIRESIEEEGVDGSPIEIATENDNNTLCLACHSTHGYFETISKEWVADYGGKEDSIAAVVKLHSNHSWDPSNNNGTSGASRCSKCHNPKIAKSAVHYDIHSHTFEPISPEKTLEFAMPNACAVSCHNKNGYTFGIEMSGDDYTKWDEPTDKALAEKLLFWYENMWHDGVNENNNLVTATSTTTPPTMDGDDSDWSGTYEIIPLANGKEAMVQAQYTDTDLYMLFKWADSTASFTRGAWERNGNAWTAISGQSEDRLAMMWNMTIPDEDWNSRGCMNKCHRNVDNTNPGQDSTTSEDDAYLPDGQLADMWHMKAARSLGVTSASGSGLSIDPVTHEVKNGTVSMMGFIDDKYMGPYSVDNAPDGGRYGDAGSSTYARNRTSDKSGPQYIETSPTDFMDAMILTQAEIDSGEAVDATTLTGQQVSDAWDIYAGFNAAVPERILRAPAGSRGDVVQAATWSGGYWITEIKRALDTGNSADDAAFAVSNEYKFGISLMDNAGGDGHWSQGKALTTLKLGPSAIGTKETGTVHTYELSQNYPNPFNPTTHIDFSLAKAGKVAINVYNMLGQKVATLINGQRPAGKYTVEFDGSNLASGIYIIRMENPEFTKSRKVVLLK